MNQHVSLKQSMDYMLDAMKIVAKEIEKNFDQTETGRIIEKMENNRYKVKIRDVVYIVKSKFIYEEGERVFVLFPCGNKHDLYLYPNR